MLDEFINTFFYSFLLPIKEGFQIFVWSNAFYFSIPILFLLSIPHAIMRFFQVAKKIRTNYYGVLELFVWLSRLLQYSLIVFIGNDRPVGHLFLKQEWTNIFQGFNLIDSNQLIWGLVGYCIIFGIYNIILHLVIRKNWTIRLYEKVFHSNTSNKEAVHSATILVFKNLFLIPVSIIYLLKLFQFI
ncbi:hypothetical protein [Fictibacillus phosphorivorans]|uniref:hypothetical protein n=1 Tax=Fictibacillus phosphorivorans TaxID=1221500 RepID=UPI00203DE1F5|nr:hypothetical protein [Fictibacillus phosphorivorans]MCM3718089.1 hypothetical protein [Fictibacillus phosphorivorans]MCM3775716.1 hypothetical protein [Fictibacillus phosphorivorans]